MSSATRIARNTSVLLISQIISFGESAVYTILVARYLGAEGLGILNFGVALTAIFSIFASFGLTTLAIREVARDNSQASKYVANIIPIQMLLALFTVGLIAVLVNVLGYPQQTIYVVYILSISLIVSTFSNLFLAIFQAFEQLEFQAIALIITSVVALCAAVLGIRLHANVVAFAFFMLVSNGAALVYVYAVYATFWRSAFKEAWPMLAAAIGVAIYFRIDVVMISLIQGATAVGFYSVAYTLSEASTVVGSMFVTSLFPVLSRQHQNSKASLRDTSTHSLRYMLYFALPMAFFVTLWAKPIVSLLFGSAFDPSVTALQVLIWAAALMYLAILLGNVLFAANLQRVSLILISAAVAVNVSLNVLLIPKYSYFGASFATVATEASLVALDLIVLGRYGYDLRFRRTSLLPVFGLCVIVAISALLFLRNVPVALITIVDLTVYAALIYKLGLNEQDKRLIGSLLKLSRPGKSER